MAWHAYLYPEPLWVRNTFIDDPAGRLDSLEGFLHERQAFSCPVSRASDESGEASRPAKAASEQLEPGGGARVRWVFHGFPWVSILFPPVSAGF